MSIQVFASNLEILGFSASIQANISIAIDNKLFTVRGVNNDRAFERICLFLFGRIDANRTESDLKCNLIKSSCAGKKTFVYKVYKWLIEIRERSNLFDQTPIRRSELLSYQGKNLVKNMAALSEYVAQKMKDKACNVQKASVSDVEQPVANKSIQSEDIQTPEYRPRTSAFFQYTINSSFINAAASSSCLALPSSVVLSKEEASLNLPSLRDIILKEPYGPELKPLNWYLPLVDEEVKRKPSLLTQRFTPPSYLMGSHLFSPTPSRKRRYEEDESVIYTPPTYRRRL
ncbi:hypothetical protein MAM1_0256c08814 [Mucor ambiguus]|uniref:HAUS augmin-like complex subunit 6 N-terminal domain-containing protein n=1 Tax=Mucor ambiguus TaxID=91626 RepID=A0A0C9MPC2_9FUNG|nr:hypothetical protein MAM1_0256c08814 [Mucor ambiguus]